jgi:hypothetical protein
MKDFIRKRRGDFHRVDEFGIIVAITVTKIRVLEDEFRDKALQFFFLDVGESLLHHSEIILIEATIRGNPLQKEGFIFRRGKGFQIVLERQEFGIEIRG